MAKIFATDPPRGFTSFAWLVVGGSICVASVAWSLKALRRVSAARDDRDRYGRHMVGLTFLLFLICLCNAVGTSSLAFSGALGFSAASLLEASNPKQGEEAAAAAQRAIGEAKASQRALVATELEKARAQQDVSQKCSTALEAKACDVAQARLVAAEDEKVKLSQAAEDAREWAMRASASSDEKHRSSKRALFFLLSISTLMSLFGASFYVVNQVRKKRASIADDFEASDAAPEGEGATTKEKPNIATNASVAAVVETSLDGSETEAVLSVSDREPSRGTNGSQEAFDAYAFWSGALFRAAEAVLFTFAFFWLIWTSDRRTEAIWLPVIALFVGMFVKTGETIVFRLGMRVLHAAEALLPAVGNGGDGRGRASERL
jgi:hypothetical protein